jgi:flagellar biosynthesis GTPase FlhF
VAYISEGQKIPEDLIRARPYSLVSKAVTMMQQSEILMNSGSVSLGNNEELFNAHAQ